ncbi:16S rRNA (guanine(527)-N(7))-methyltransferase RsmG [Roseibium denhamense]|uniref:Ribosomal RNA small subunit methyltransferase G n=1 Tax=Roseibium denhamense TaxID=76305 RepID=A0ABY1PEV9_9HYPH|nr:16S rRNA (guanine(527)-N(7))-methyltransferase RsmG [Roseibium denhamense]MTI05273.1 16S rRNA (guanine(527)-N(7))-methyltransferase RsmG [Roseibium denhamense]SMP30569.1 16S rRNA (guanine527-N7)-methyltransferase [Roseibium denhamense]
MTSAPVLKSSGEVVRKYGDVSRETLERLQIYVDLVLKWQPAQNLVAPSTLPEIWTRHIADSLQTQWSYPEAQTWVDIGSGGGFPGIVTAILLADRSDAHVHLIESNQRKAAFLRTALRETGSNGTVHPGRIESVAKEWAHGKVDVVSARALASLDLLFKLSEPFTAQGARAVFHKGQDFQREVNEASDRWRFDLVEQTSLVDPTSRMLLFSNISARPSSL